ncbi:hypothetical protein LEMA_P119860.1 [Plenodomus lingam JN3]|uniref:Uncharacterized protein n=1 Tax=Leptosphaeria maculans (strain JN3 / isolate v23.1.3 / race Av1-4-5-6-7-8) TaxID=985895 RepID=E4ZT64_LEPMJ|nr:hypothetical protein LEMA_P119860.1 [Plenodomus lingam JN3]CBX94495.1 hypothetical protein LEMA_P119860.1 [Plenodomus lingam JN3]
MACTVRADDLQSTDPSSEKRVTQYRTSNSSHRGDPKLLNIAMRLPFEDEIYLGGNEWQASANDEHPFTNLIREAIKKHRIQSLEHHARNIDVNQSNSKRNPRKEQTLTPQFKMEVGFHHWCRGPITRLCGPESQKTSRNSPRFMTDNIVVYEEGVAFPLAEFLELQFPILDELPLPSSEMYKWWCKNGKTFNWEALPTELKENIVSHCFRDTPFTSIRPPPRRYLKKTTPQPYEVTDHFDNASSLLCVSHQVRYIALRVCLQGIKGHPVCQGLSVGVVGGGPLDKCIRRLGNFHQMLHPEGVPVDEKTAELAMLYKQYPRIYPQLSQYATFAHGIRRVCMRMDFHSYFSFFKLTSHGLRDHWSRFNSGYEMLEQLPALEVVVLELPEPEGTSSRYRPSRMMPPLFYRDHECPRTLHRLIYEKAAEVLALYPVVAVFGFIDELEKERFYSLRRAAIEGLKFTSDELADLYKDDGGGIELEEIVNPGLLPHEIEECREGTRNGLMSREDLAFWPPKCRCTVPCSKVLHPDD